MRRGAICVSSLRGLAREIRQKASGDSWNSAWPTDNSVPEPVSGAMGGFGLGLRTGHHDRQGLIASTSTIRVRLSGYGLEGVFIMAWLPALVSPERRD